MQTKDLKIILKVAECQSISAAAKQLNISAATASAAIKRVEKLLGTALFIRSTRRLRLSTAGERYLPKCQEAITLLNQAKHIVKTEENIIDGDLRIALPSDLGRNVILPVLDQFVDEHPLLNVKVHVSNRLGDFSRDPVDVALRYGSSYDNNLYGFKICDTPQSLYASPSYLEKYGTPTHPDELSGHNGLFYQLYDRVFDTWYLTRKNDEKPYKIKITSNRVSNDADLVRRWCVAGYGLALKSYLDMMPHLQRGEVVKVLPEYLSATQELWLVCPSRHLITPAVRLLRDRLRTHCEAVLQSTAAQAKQ